MRYLGLALFREGPTDYRFLNKLLPRVAQQICLEHSQEPVEIGEVLELLPPRGVKSKDRAIQILEAARQAVDAYQILFIHVDGDGDPEAARKNSVNPAVDMMQRDTILNKAEPVAVIPVREMEAWALADGDALRQTFGTNLDDAKLGVCKSQLGVEKILDPKMALNRAYFASIKRRGRKKQTAAGFLDILGEKVSLHKLRSVPAFQSFESEFNNALQQLGYISRRRS